MDIKVPHGTISNGDRARAKILAVRQLTILADTKTLILSVEKETIKF
jgi:hypothetical protein